MKVLITGIKGFIGQHLSRKLIERGHKVRGLENKVGGVLNKKLVEHAIRGYEVVVHLAARTSHKDIVDNKFETLEINFLGTKNILDAFSKSKTAKKFLYASTGKVYGKIIRLPITEEHPTNPLNILGKSKLITEKLIDFYNNDQKELVIFRIFNVYGPGQKENFLIPTILSQVNSGKKEIVSGNIRAKRDYVYIDDLVDAFVKAIERKSLRGLSIYNTCMGIGSSARDIVQMVGKIKGTNIKIKVSKSLLRQDEMDNEYGSYEKAKKELRWRPKVNLEDGLRKLMVKKMQAVILAGGKGTRMQKKYPRIPKLLIPFNGKPSIDYLIEHLKRSGFDNIIICTGFLGDNVQKYIKRKKYGVKIHLSIEKEPLGTGGALNSIKNLLDNDFFLFYGDVYTTLDPKKMFDFHKRHKGVVTAAVHPSVHPVDSDLIEFGRHFRITNILRKPHKEIPKNPYNLAALYMVSSRIKKYLTLKVPYDFVHDLLPKLLDENVAIYGYNTDEFIMDFGTPERLVKLENKLRK